MSLSSLLKNNGSFRYETLLRRRNALQRLFEMLDSPGIVGARLPDDLGHLTAPGRISHCAEYVGISDAAGDARLYEERYEPWGVS